MYDVIIKTKVFLSLFVIFVLGGIILQMSYSKTELFLLINNNYHPLTDVGFKYFTHLGHGLFSVLISFIFLLKKYRYAFIVLLSYLLSGLVSQVLKIFVFPDIMRPLACNEINCHLVEGVRMNMYHGFPSGHTVSAFALFLCLSYFSKKRYLQVVFFLLAVMIGYSRIYLAQHFFIDVYFGALIGVTFALVSIIIIKNIQKGWMDNSIITLFKAKSNAK